MTRRHQQLEEKRGRPNLFARLAHPEPTPNPSQEGSGLRRFVPLLGGGRGGFTAGSFMERSSEPLCAPGRPALQSGDN